MLAGDGDGEGGSGDAVGDGDGSGDGDESLAGAARRRGGATCATFVTATGSMEGTVGCSQCEWMGLVAHVLQVEELRCDQVPGSQGEQAAADSPDHELAGHGWQESMGT